MPELPEVERFRRVFESGALGKTIERTHLMRHEGRKFTVLRNSSEEEFRRATEGHTFTGDERIGKFLVTYLSNGQTVIFHFMLSGTLIVTAPGRPLEERPASYMSLRFLFSDGASLWFGDRRNLARALLAADRDFSGLGILEKMGVDPLTPAFTYERFRQIFAEGGDRPVKTVLTDQKKISGIGNEYSDLADYLAGVRPTRRADSLSEDEVRRLYDAVRRVLTEAVEEPDANRHPFMRERRKGGKCPKHPDVAMEAVRWGASHAYFCPVEQE